MQSHSEDKNLPREPSRLLGALARELKNPLVLIARQAELEKSKGSNQAFDSLQKTAEKTLRLIDGYLLMAQTEYGQRSLPLETVGIGAVIYDVINGLRLHGQHNNVDFYYEVKDANVMAHREGLKTVIWSLSELALIRDYDREEKRQKVVIRTAVKDEKVSVDILGSALDISGSDIDLARRLQGTSHYALGNKLDESGIRMAIADVLAESLGSKLHAKKNKGLRGLSLDLLVSKQLQLV